MSTTFFTRNQESYDASSSHNIIPEDMLGQGFETQFPTKTIKSTDATNKSVFNRNQDTKSHVAALQKMMNKASLSDRLGLKTPVYLAGDKSTDRTKSKTNVDSENLSVKNEKVTKSQAIAMKTWKQGENEKKAAQSFQQNMTKSSVVKRNQTENIEEGLAKSKTSNSHLFKRTAQLYNGAKAASSKQKSQEGKFQVPCDQDEAGQVTIYNIKKEALDKESALANKINIRILMGGRSTEDQGNKNSEQEEKEKLSALREARRAKVEDQEGIKMAKSQDLGNLSETWKVNNKHKLERTIRDELQKGKEKKEERKILNKAASGIQRPVSSGKPKETSVKEEEKPKTAALKPTQIEAQKENFKPQTSSPTKMKKLPTETKEDYKKRVSFATMPQEKDNLNPVQQHKFIREFQEMIVGKGIKKNGKLQLK